MDPAQFQQMMQMLHEQQAAQNQNLLAAMQQVQQQAQQQAQQAQQQAQQQLQQAAAAVAVAAPAAAAAPAHAAHRGKIPAASNYSGSASTLDSWLREMQQQFDWYQYAAADQVAMAAAQLRGAALDWWAGQLSAAEQTTLRASFAAFETALRGRFQPVNRAQTARLALDSLRQGAKQPVADYISAFRRLLVPVPDMSEADKVHRFVQGLRGPVQQHLIVQGVDTLDKAITMAARVGTLGLFAAASSAAAAAGHGAGGDPMDLNALGLDSIEGLEQEETDGSTTPQAPDAAVMRAELHKMHQQLLAALQQQRASGGAGKRAPFGRGERHTPRVPGLTPQQVRERMDGGLCFVCGKEGHRKYDCPQGQGKPQHKSGN